MKPEPTSELLRARAKLHAGGLEAALENLKYKRGTIFEFVPTGIVDDQSFREQYPDHPMASPQRFIRIEAADRLKDLSGTSPELFTNDEIAALHEALLDRCAAVRMSVVETIERLNKPESAGPLRHLLEVEDESQWVRNAAVKALQSLASG